MSRYTEAQYEDAIEEMMGKPRYVADFIFDGAETEELLRLVLSRGLPLRDRSASDDRLVDAYDAQIEALRAAFAKFAHEGKSTKRASRVDEYLDYRMEQAA